MTTRGWKVVGAAIAAIAYGGAANATPLNGGGNSNPSLSVRFDPGDSSLRCPNATACFDVTSHKRISHAFVRLEFKFCGGQPDLQITVDGAVVPADKLHAGGGPCNETGQGGEDLVPRQVWFPLTGNHHNPEVCVTTFGEIPSAVLVGAKSAEECQFDVASASCQICDEPSTCDP